LRSRDKLWRRTTKTLGSGGFPVAAGDYQVNDVVWWLILFGLAVAIIGLYIVSVRVEKHMRDTTVMMIHGYDSIMAHLRRLSGKRIAETEPVVGAILDRRCGHRRARAPQMSELPEISERRKSTGRRREDLVAVK
jgi:hypothetical protein